MKHVLILIFTCLTSMNGFSQNDNLNGTTAYYLIRHAEKDRTDPSNKNPHLTESGNARAENWSIVFQNISFDAVYSTNYNRTIETAKPTATKNGLKLTIYDAKKVDIPSFLNDTKGKTVLIVGHSDTIPNFVNGILDSKKYVDIDDSNNGNLYLITIIDGKKSDQVLTIN